MEDNSKKIDKRLVGIITMGIGIFFSLAASKATAAISITIVGAAIYISSQLTKEN